MLKVIEIENIKGIGHKRFALDIWPNKPSLLVAPNGFGKSSFAVAINEMGCIANCRVHAALARHLKFTLNTSFFTSHHLFDSYLTLSFNMASTPAFAHLCPDNFIRDCITVRCAASIAPEPIIKPLSRYLSYSIL